MITNAKFVHTNLIAKDWRLLSRFYQDVFGCTPVLPERDLSGPMLEAGTGISGARLRGMHLRVPGFGGEGPTLEIFQYAEPAPGSTPAVNRPGFGHIAFSVPSVLDARAQVLAAGGKPVGEVVATTISNGATVTWCYVRDPEGNIVELQAWS
jgi:catechol 2,3-dioxygenase-like lactoylglutathione lyase family enzyme